MPRLTPVSRRELIRRLSKLGFEGPFAGGRHEFMARETRRLVLPDPHRSDIGVALLSRLLKQADISADDWESAGR